MAAPTATSTARSAPVRKACRAPLISSCPIEPGMCRPTVTAAPTDAWACAATPAGTPRSTACMWLANSELATLPSTATPMAPPSSRVVSLTAEPTPA